MKAIIMAGGEGTRLRPLTCTMPKPMAHVMNKPIMEHIINLLKKYDITDIGVTLMYMPEEIKEHFGNGEKFGVNISYFCEKEPLGTAGSVKATAEFIDDDFLVISGDALCDIDLNECINYHKEKQSCATLVLKSMEVPLPYGVVVTNAEGRIIRFLEKPMWSQVFSDTVNTGIYILSPSVLDMIDTTPCDFSKDVFPGLLSEGKPIYGFLTDGYWCDIGDLDAYRHCHYDILDHKLNIETSSDEYKIEEGAKIGKNVLIGRGSVIKKGANIDSYSVIGENVTVYPGASIKRSIIYDGCVIGHNTEIRGAVICKKSIIKQGGAVYEQCIIGENSVIGEDAKIKPGVKIWPHKVVSDGEVVSENVIWGNSLRSGLFDEIRIKGEINTDISPFLAAKIGAAFGSMKKGGKIALASDGSGAADMIKSAVKSGLMSTGAKVFDFGTQQIPVTRAGVYSHNLCGGIHICSYCDSGGGACHLDILDSNGSNISFQEERKMERILNFEEFTMKDPDNIHKPAYIGEYKFYYLENILSSLKCEKINQKVYFGFSGIKQGVEEILLSAAEELGATFYFKENVNLNDEESVKKFAEETVLRDCAFGVVFDRFCEKMILVDDRGSIIDEDLYKAVTSLIIMKKYKNPLIVAGVSAPGVIDKLAEKYSARVLRTKESELDIMQVMSNDKENSEMREEFLFAFDAPGAAIKILDYLNYENITLSSLVSEIPAFYVVRKEVPCKTGDKGKIIKEISKESKQNSDTGVKIEEENARVLIIPHATRPLCRIICESPNEEYAEAITEIYREKINEIKKH